MKTIKITDYRNLDKVWIIKRYRSGNYYLNQIITGKQYYRKFIRTTKEYLQVIGLLPVIEKLV